ncbi:hypothetical protein L208DRAFT_1401379 [Tricholoma matsutake]|nr:hypothetical protein L208DRAFT_1401379 [Tricholoma matsutake 945]
MSHHLFLLTDEDFFCYPLSPTPFSSIPTCSIAIPPSETCCSLRIAIIERIKPKNSEAGTGCLAILRLVLWEVKPSTPTRSPPPFHPSSTSASSRTSKTL